MIIKHVRLPRNMLIHRTEVLKPTDSAWGTLWVNGEHFRTKPYINENSFWLQFCTLCRPKLGPNLSKFMWACLGSFWTFWVLLGPFMTIWDLLGPLGTLWDHWGPFGTL